MCKLLPAILPLLIVYIFLDTLEPTAHNPACFTGRFLLDGRFGGLHPLPPRALSHCEARRCNICRAGPCSVSIPSVPREDTGCACRPPKSRSARTAVRRFTTCRRRSRRAFGCGRARFPAIARSGVGADAHAELIGAALDGQRLDPSRENGTGLVPAAVPIFILARASRDKQARAFVACFVGAQADMPKGHYGIGLHSAG